MAGHTGTDAQRTDDDDGTDDWTDERTEDDYGDDGMDTTGGRMIYVYIYIYSSIFFNTTLGNCDQHANVPVYRPREDVS